MRHHGKQHPRPAPRLALFLPLLLVMCGCGLEHPQAPSFETEINIPVGSLRYTVAELIESEERLEGDTTGTNPVYFTYDGTIDSVEVGDRLDGGRVAAISETELSYVKNGRTIVLPRRPDDRPDLAFIEERYAAFRSAG